jgi:hypothetical protein
METAAKILVLGGVLNLALAFILGFALSRYRVNAPHVGPPYLHLAHKNALWEGFMLLGLVFAVQLAQMTERTKVIAALLVVAASVLQDGSSITAWLMGTKDEFAQRSLSFYLATANAILASIGLAILVFGVIRTLIQQGF